jgi:tape measure domain-containing protein
MVNRDVELRIKAKDEASRQLKDIQKAIQSFADSQKLIKESTQENRGVLGAFGVELGRVAAELQKLSDLRGFAESSEKLSVSLNETKDSLTKVRSEIQPLEKITKDYDKALKSNSESLSKNKKDLERQAASAARLKEELVKVRQRIIDTNAALRQVRTAEFRKTRGEDEQAKQTERLTSQLERLKAKQQELRDTSGQLTERTKLLKQTKKELTAEENRLQKESNRYGVELGNLTNKLERNVERSVALKNQKAALEQASKKLNAELRTELKTLEEIDAAQKRSLQLGARLQSGAAQVSGIKAKPATEKSDAQTRLAAASRETEKLKRETADLIKLQERQVRPNRELNEAIKNNIVSLREKNREILKIKGEPFRKLGQEIGQTSDQIRANTQRIQELSKIAGGRNIGAREAKAEILELVTANRLLEQRLGSLRGAFAQNKTTLTNAVSEYRVLSSETRRTSSSLDALRASFSGLVRNTQSAVQPLRTLREALTGAGAAALQLGSQTAPLGAALRGLRSQATVTASAFLGFFAVFRQVQEVVNAFRTVEAAKNRLGVLFDGDELRINREFVILRTESKRLGIDLGVLADEYSKFAIAAKQSNISLQTTRDLFIAVSEAGRVNKLSNEQLGGTFLALTQIISKGKLQAEEITRQLGDRLPGAVGILANALTDGDIPAFFKQLEQGQLRPTEENLKRIANSFNDIFGSQLQKSLQTVTTQVAQFGNNIFLARQTIAQSGFIDAFASAVRSLNEAFSSREGEQFFVDLGQTLAIFGESVSAVIRNVDVLASLLRQLALVKIAQFFLGAVASIQQYTIALGANNKVAAFFLQLQAKEIPVALGQRFSIALRNLTNNLRAVRNELNLTSVSFKAFSFSAKNAALATAGFALRGVAVLGSALTALVGGPLGLVILGLEALSNVFTGQGLIENFLSFNNVLDETSEKALKAANAVEKTVEALTQAKGDAGEAQSIVLANIDVEAVQAQIAQVQRQIEEGRNKIAEDARVNISDPIFTLPPSEDFVETTTRLNALAESLRDGQTKAKDFRIRVQELVAPLRGKGEAAENARRQILANAEALIQNTEKVKNLENGLKELQAVLGVAIGDQASADFLRNTDLSAENVSKIVEFGKELDALNKEFNKDAVEREGLEFQIASLQERINGFKSEGVDLTEEENRILDQASAILDLMVKARQDMNPATRTLVGLDEEIETLQIKINGFLIDDVVLRAESVAAQLALNKAIKDGVTDQQELLDIQEKAAEAIRLRLQLNKLETEERKRNRPGRAGRKPPKSEEEKQAEKQAKFDQEQLRKAQEERDKLRISTIADERERQIQLAQLQAINDAKRQGVQISKNQLDVIASITGAKFDLENPTKRLKDAEADINKKLRFRETIIQRIDSLRRRGDGEAVNAADKLEKVVAGTTEELLKQVDAAIELAEKLGDIESAERLRTQRIVLETERLENLGGLGARELNQLFAGQATNAVDQFFDKIAEGENAIKSLGEVFRGFFRDLLRQLANLLLNEAFLTLLGGGRGNRGGGLGSTLSSTIADFFFHDGGMVTTSGAKSISAFAGVKRYHSGGFPGLKSDEVPAILQTGEEVLARNDPRNAKNGGASQANVRVINTIDAASFISQGLSTPQGEKVILNYISANRNAVRGLLGV